VSAVTAECDRHHPDLRVPRYSDRAMVGEKSDCTQNTRTWRTEAARASWADALTGPVLAATA